MNFPSYPFTIGRTVAIELPSQPRQFDEPFPAIGEVCFAQWEGRGQYHQVLVQAKAKRNPNAYIVVFMDTNERKSIHEALIRAPPPPTELGDIVQCHTNTHNNTTTFDVQLDNGQLLTGVSSNKVSKPPRWRPAKQRPVTNHSDIPMWQDLQFKYQASTVKMPTSMRLSVSCETCVDSYEASKEGSTTATATATTATSVVEIVPSCAYVQFNPANSAPGVYANCAPGTTACAITDHPSSRGQLVPVTIISHPATTTNMSGKHDVTVSIQLEDGEIMSNYPLRLLATAPPPAPTNSFFTQQTPPPPPPPAVGQTILFFQENEGWKTGIVLSNTIPPMGIDVHGNVAIDAVLNNQITMWQGDITTLNVDAIQNAANSGLWSGGGICGAIFGAACEFDLSREVQRRYPDGCLVGQTAISSGGQLHAKHVLHTVGPRGEKPNLLASAYRSALDQAAANGITSVALCCISTGIFGYPPECAAPIAVRTVRKWLEERKADVAGEMKVIFCLFLDSDVELYRHWMHEWFPKEDKANHSL